MKLFKVKLGIHSDGFYVVAINLRAIGYEYPEAYLVEKIEGDVFIIQTPEVCPTPPSP